MSKEVMLSTIENPYNPFDDPDRWLAFDLRLSCSATSFLAAFTSTVSEEFPESVIDREIEAAIDRIIENDPLNRFIKVVKDDSNVKAN